MLQLLLQVQLLLQLQLLLQMQLLLQLQLQQLLLQLWRIHMRVWDLLPLQLLQLLLQWLERRSCLLLLAEGQLRWALRKDVLSPSYLLLHVLLPLLLIAS